MKFTILVVVLAFISLTAEAEMVDGPANVRDKPNGRVIISLNDNVEITCNKINDNWLDITIPVYVDVKGSFSDEANLILNKNVKLYDEHGNNIGVVLKRIEAEPFGDDGIYNGRRIVVLKGFTYRRNIRQDSILEFNLGAVLDGGNAASLTDFRGHLDLFHYKVWAPRGRFSPYVYFDRAVNDVTPWPRAILFFYEERLVAVYHDKPIKSHRITPSVMIRGGMMSYVMGVSPEIRKKLAAIYYPIIEAAD